VRPKGNSQEERTSATILQNKGGKPPASICLSDPAIVTHYHHLLYGSLNSVEKIFSDLYLKWMVSEMKLNDCPTRLMQPTQKAARLISDVSLPHKNDEAHHQV